MEPEVAGAPLDRTVYVSVLAVLVMALCLQVGVSRDGVPVERALLEASAIGVGWRVVGDEETPPVREFCDGRLPSDAQVQAYAGRAHSDSGRGVVLHEVYEFRRLGAAFSEYAGAFQSCTQFSVGVRRQQVSVTITPVSVTPEFAVARLVARVGSDRLVTVVAVARSAQLLHVLSVPDDVGVDAVVLASRLARKLAAPL